VVVICILVIEKSRVFCFIKIVSVKKPEDSRALGILKLEMILKYAFKNGMGRGGTDASGSGWTYVMSYLIHGDEISGFVNAWFFLTG
jgi:hypothetical protein